jgi:SPP1 gp7 family putative phage head morphogenesis protein
MPTNKLERESIVLKPIRSNGGVEAAYRARLQSIIRQMALSVLRHVRAAYKAHNPEIGFASDAADPTIALRRALKRWGDDWRSRLDDASTEIASSFAGRARRNLDAVFRKRLKDAGFVVKFRPTTQMVSAYRAVISENVNLIKSIAPQFLKGVETAVWDAVMKGSNLAQLSAKIEHHYRVSHKRAAFIARDQNAKARAVMEEARRSELGITEAIWLHSHAGKEPRPTHVAMHGKKYEIKRGMYDSAVGEYVWPGTLPNCRCTSRAVIQ